MFDHFTDEETAILERYFTNVDKPVFALVNLPEVVKGALFARYSRSPLSLRRLFLNEFLDELEPTASTASARSASNQSASARSVSNRSASTPSARVVGYERAAALYDRVFFQYGDDSVAQLGGAHIACEQSSNVLTKVLEWGRLMSYLEQSTRYMVYNRSPRYFPQCDGTLNGDGALNSRSSSDGESVFPYYRDPCVLRSPFGGRYIHTLDAMFETYLHLTDKMRVFFSDLTPQTASDSDFAYRRATTSRALDVTRSILPAATLSNVGIYGSGQAYEALLLRMRAHKLIEVQTCANSMLEELRKVIPSFLKRVDLPDRGQLTTEYLANNRDAMGGVANRFFERSESQSFEQNAIQSNGINGSGSSGVSDASTVDSPVADDFELELVDFDPEGEEKAIVAMLYPYTSLPESVIWDRVRMMSHEERLEVVAAYCGKRTNRRHRPGRALERTFYRFDMVSDYGSFRDLQRHRMLTIEWQTLSTRHGYSVPKEIAEASYTEPFEDAMGAAADLYDSLISDFPDQASYVVPFAYRVRYSMQFNAREAMHMLELRTQPEGHRSYRNICRQMHQLIAEKAQHRTLAAMMHFVNHNEAPVLGRLNAENLNVSKGNLKVSKGRS